VGISPTRIVYNDDLCPGLENLIVDRYGIFTANLKQERPPSTQDLFNYFTGAITAAVAVNVAILLVPGWRRAKKQRIHLRVHKDD
jgi:hypothetical protein